MNSLPRASRFWAVKMDLMVPLKVGVFYGDEDKHLSEIASVIRSQPIRQIPPAEYLFIFGPDPKDKRAEAADGFWNYYVFDDHGRWRQMTP